MANQNEPECYEVGYGKPPRHTRWKSGQSGNPRGRPKKTKEFERLVETELDQIVHITENGERRTLSKREVIVKGLINGALKGDVRSLKLIMPYLTQQREPDGFEPDAADRAAFADLLGRFAATPIDEMATGEPPAGAGNSEPAQAAGDEGRTS